VQKLKPKIRFTNSKQINVSETVQHLLHHLLYAIIFVHCENWLVKLTPELQATYSCNKVFESSEIIFLRP
jgi:hypothetical protein